MHTFLVFQKCKETELSIFFQTIYNISMYYVYYVQHEIQLKNIIIVGNYKSCIFPTKKEILIKYQEAKEQNSSE